MKLIVWAAKEEQTSTESKSPVNTSQAPVYYKVVGLKVCGPGQQELYILTT